MVYQDGSVLLTHGGTEMGQGLHTKMIQVASQVQLAEILLVHTKCEIIFSGLTNSWFFGSSPLYSLLPGEGFFSIESLNISS